MNSSQNFGHWRIVIFFILAILFVGSFLQMVSVGWLAGFTNPNVEPARYSSLLLKFKIYAALAGLSGLSVLVMVFRYFQRRRLAQQRMKNELN